MCEVGWSYLKVVEGVGGGPLASGGREPARAGLLGAQVPGHSRDLRSGQEGADGTNDACQGRLEW